MFCLGDNANRHDHDRTNVSAPKLDWPSAPRRDAISKTIKTGGHCSLSIPTMMACSLTPLLLLLGVYAPQGSRAWMVGSPSRMGRTTLASTTPESVPSASSTDDSWISQELETSGNNDVVRGPSQVLMYDTTLRDGTQGEGISASVDDKLKICRRLATFGVDYIEAGWPGSNPKDAAFFARAPDELPVEAIQKLVAFGSTRRKALHNRVAEDPQVQALIDSQAPTICIVAKAHSWHVTDILKTDRETNLAMISDTVAYLVEHDRKVMVDLEHFFDGYTSDPEYALQCCQAAVTAGASCLVLCDTNGGSMPWDVATMCDAVVQACGDDVTVGVHCHNDCGMAVANSIMAAKHGVGLIQGTMNGVGERTGNADLSAIIPTLALHVESKLGCQPKLTELTQVSHYVDEILNRTPNAAAPFVGSSAFAHKGGLHVAAMERSPLSYQHIRPELVGNEKRVLISELSGRQNIVDKIQEVGVKMDEELVNERVIAILNHVKDLESRGYTFEGADASVHLMVLHATKGYCPPFRVLDYSTNVYDTYVDSASRVLAQHKEKKNQANPHAATTRATVNVRMTSTSSVDDEAFRDCLQVSDGNGPVDALSKALMRSLVESYPSLQNIELVDYKVRILDPQAATGAVTRVLIEFRDTENDTTWTTVAADANVISASLNALIDGFEYALIEHAESCMLCDDFFQ